jgi:hypothetical protein
VPTVRPRMEIPVISWITWVDFFASKYLRAILNGRFIDSIIRKQR